MTPSRGWSFDAGHKLASEKAGGPGVQEILSVWVPSCRPFRYLLGFLMSSYLGLQASVRRTGKNTAFLSWGLIKEESLPPALLPLHSIVRQGSLKSCLGQGKGQIYLHLMGRGCHSGIVNGAWGTLFWWVHLHTHLESAAHLRNLSHKYFFQLYPSSRTHLWESVILLWLC